MKVGLSPNFRGMDLPSTLVTALEDAFRALREIKGIGVDPDSLDQLVSRKELLNWGVATTTENGGIGAGAGENVFSSQVPFAPSNLTVAGGYAQVLLKWAAPIDSVRGYFEIYRSATNNIGVATKIAQTTAWIYSDSIQNGQTYYYWVRSVSKHSVSIVSAWNATAGTPGSTAADIDYALGVLTGANGAQPFYYLAAPQVIDGIALPAGVYMKTAYIRDAVVRYFRAGEAIIDSASIIDLTADKITTGTMSADRIETNSLIAKEATFTVAQVQTIFANKAFINSAMIAGFLQSDNFNGNPSTNNPGTAGWYIGRDGKLYLQDAVIKGTILSSSFVGGSFTGGNFTGANFFGGLFQGGTFEGNVLRSSGAGLNYNTPIGSRVGNVSGYNAFWNLAATGTQLAFHIFGKIRMYADGLLEADEPVISKANVLASGTATNLVVWTYAAPPSNPGGSA